jgi:uncharacterized protein YpmB
MQFKHRPASQAAINRQTYIPPAVQQSMNQQLRRTAPAHLKKYVGTGAYVPQQAQKALEQHMQKAAPGHQKQYAGAFVQQNVVQPGLSGPAAGVSTPPPDKPPAPNQLRRDHSNVPGAQYEVEFNNLFQPDQTAGEPQVQNYPPQPAGPQSEPPRQAYDFILSPERPHHRFVMPGGGNKLARAAFIGGGLIILLIIFSLLKSIFSNAPDLTPYVSAAQDQQALIHLAIAAVKQQDLSVVNKNYSYTAQMSLTSAQSDLTVYLTKNHHKVNKKTLNLKVSAAADTRLTNATAAGTYNSTYHDLVESRLKTYLNNLNHAYQTSSGKKGRALLKDDYSQAQLLLKQLNAPAT